MRYLILNYSPMHDDGISQVVCRLIDNFSSDFKKKTIIICNDLEQPDKFYFKGIRCVNLRTKSLFILEVLFLYSRLLYSFRIYKFLRDNINYGDIINIHEGAGISFFIALLRNKIKNKFKIAITLHGSSFCLYTDIAKRLPSSKYLIKISLLIWRWYVWFIENEVLKKCDYVIFITQKTKTFCENVYNFNGKCAVIPNGIESYKRTVKLKQKLNNKQWNAIIIGSRTYIKGLDIAIEALKEINKSGLNVKLNIVGFKDFRQYYKKNIPAYVNYIGIINPNEVGQWYERSDFMLFPSRWEEPPSLVIMEALQHGLPFITSIACRENEILGFESLGLVVDSYDVSEWVEAINLMKKIDIFEKFRSNIEQKDFSRYDWKEYAYKYEQLFNHLSGILAE